MSDAKKASFNKDMTIGDVLQKNPKSQEILSKYFGSSCLMCGAAAFETIEMACASHNIPDKVGGMLKELNNLKPIKSS